MLDVLTAEDVRRQDAACEARGIATATLMGNAGYGVARAARRILGGSYGRRVVVVCGKGNNAGDGLVSGRTLAAWGASVTAVMLLGSEAGGAAAEALRRFPGRRVDPADLARELDRADLAIDAIFGVGLSRPPEGPAAAAIEQLNRARRVLAVDVPSGVDADTGRILGAAAVRAHATVTLGGLKPGLIFEPGGSAAGAVEVADIGVPQDLRGGSASAFEAADVRAVLPSRDEGTNKRRIGTVLLIAGCRAMPGAAALAAAASVHTGAGLTIVAAPESVVPVLVARVPEVTTIPLPESGEGTLDSKALELIHPRLEEAHAAAIGPGLTTHPRTVEAIRAIAGEIEVPLVVDADGLNAFAGATELLARRGAPTVLTPHSGELSRLLDRPATEIDADRLTAARAAALRFGCVVLLKGPGTVIASPDGAAFVNLTGGPGLAQGGTGDVLTGMVAALLAQTRAGDLAAAARAAAAAAWLHGRAGDALANRVAPHPASASMIVAELPAVLREAAG